MDLAQLWNALLWPLTKLTLLIEYLATPWRR